MLALNLKLFVSLRNKLSFDKDEYINQYHEKVRDFFTSTANDLTAAHLIVLESLNELMKNAVDAGAENLFMEDNSKDHASICVFDDGVGFSREFWVNRVV